MMNDLIKGGMSPPEAYAKAHAHAIERETAASKASWGDEGHEAYKERIRAGASIAAEPSDRDRHPDAHTTRYGLDESELGYKPIKLAGDIVEFPHQEHDLIHASHETHPPIQIDPLSAGFHVIGPGQPGRYPQDVRPGALPKSTRSMNKADILLAKTAEYRNWMKKVGTPTDPRQAPANVNLKQGSFERYDSMLKGMSKDQEKYELSLLKQIDPGIHERFQGWRQLNQLETELQDILKGTQRSPQLRVVKPEEGGMSDSAFTKALEKFKQYKKERDFRKNFPKTSEAHKKTLETIDKLKPPEDEDSE